MSLFTFTVTLTGGTDSLVGSASTKTTDDSIRQMIITNPSGNGTLSYGTAPAGTFTSTPATLATNSTRTIGPFSGSGPTRQSEWFFKGTNGNVVNVTLITH